MALTEEETEQKLATLLEEKSSTVEDKFTETDITYPVIEADGQWKIVTLDADTVRVMSANFTNVQDEIDQSLADLNNPDATAESAAPSSTTSIDMENDHFTLKLTQFRIAQEIDDSNCLMLYCDYTNNGRYHCQAHLSMYSFLHRRTEKSFLLQYQKKMIRRSTTTLQKLNPAIP